ncbi:HIT family protein [Vallitalea okinawensis]|uniref:HIT family protein n=1 Tax=Vallitalea okinawensis TaxID=2078660 RepID=UPI000CFCAF14|nr:HIT family protein [Vallitalea okinawensis]
MGSCEFCNLSSEDEQWLFYTSDFWKVYLADKQDYIGRCIVVSRRHCESLSSLYLQEWDDLKYTIDLLEKVISKALDATMFNWTCLMNNAQKKNETCAHVHFHLRPRYKESIKINDQVYYDEEFAHHYKNDKENKLDSESGEVLFKILKHCMTKMN